MNSTNKSGMHPDAESLTAFAEQLIPATERDRILAHMAVCDRCREVVFLAQRAMEEEQPAQVQRVQKTKTDRSWFAGWRWAWVPVAAMAGVVGFAIVQHIRHAGPQQQMAGNTAQTEVTQQVESGKTASAVPPPTQQANRERSAELSAVRQSAAPRKDRDAEALDEKKSVKQKDQKDELAQRAKSTFVLAPGLSAGSAHGVAARANSPSIGGPMASNQMQQQNNALQQDALLQTQPAGHVAANKPATAAARPGAVSESVVVQAEPRVATAQAAPAPAPAPPITLVPSTGENLVLESSSAAKLKTTKVILPSGVGALSVTAAGRHTIAIDTAGALFLSEDGGKHWQPVQTQWTGRAVLLRSRQPATDSAVLSLQQAPQFELVTDKLQTWVSADGKTWTPEKLPE